MNDDKKKQVDVEEIIKLATHAKVPPLFNTTEINGIVVKIYPFIRGHREFNYESIPENKHPQKDYSLLAAYKAELENQLELNRKNCVVQYNMIRLAATTLWRPKLRFLRVGEDQKALLTHFAATVYTFLNSVMLGTDIETIQEDSRGDMFKPKVEISNTVFDVDELIEKIETPLNNIERVVSRSVDLYFEYVNLHSQLYEFAVEEFLSNQQEELSSIEKVKQVEKARKRENVSNYDEALDLVELETGTRPFKNYESFKGARYRVKDYL